MPNNFLGYLPVIVLSSPGPVAFYVGSWPVRWYGILIALGFLAGYLIAEKLAVKNHLNLNILNDLVFLILIFSIVFARLWFVFLSWDYYKNNPDEIPKIWLGGQSVHGGIFGGIFAVALYAKIKKISFYQYIDLISVLVPFCQSVGRWGNFFNNEAYGSPVNNFFLKLFIPQEYRLEKYTDFSFFHPAFLYESVLDFLIFVFLYLKYPKWKNKNGKTFWMYLFLYSIVSFFLEFVRLDSLYLFDHIASAHILSVIIVFISLFFLLRR